ncbi:HIRAN domain-containing protein [Xanthobacter sp.]|uniref:HIRAN domain-containing protein n=1 Tax=Xanthobacter sp. TaxID=35809 RepID=UPI00345B9BD3
MTSIKFGQNRYKPAGEWVQATHLLKVAGLDHRRSDVDRFCVAVRSAEQNRLPYGLRLKLEPNNAHDSNAIAVIGYATVPLIFGRSKELSYHIGYVPAEESRSIYADLIGNGIEISSELYAIYESGHYIEVSFFVLGPPGYGVKSREKALSKGISARLGPWGSN